MIAKINKKDNANLIEVKYDFENKPIEFSPSEEKEFNKLLNEGDLSLDCKFSGNTITVGEELKSSGGQATLYKSKCSNYAIKIYNEKYRTTFYEKKLEYIINNKFEDKEICWPIDILYYNGKFIGYYMMFFQGTSLSSLISRRHINRSEPNYDKKNQLFILIKVLKTFKKLHDHGILVGDVKLQNIMYAKKGNQYKIMFVDIDSIQIDQFNCDVTTPEYDPPEIISYGVKNGIVEKDENNEFKYVNYFNYRYRTLENEYFSIAVLIYIFIMFQKPYQSVEFGGDNQVDLASNLKLCVERNFPYGTVESQTNDNCIEKEIWSHLPSFIKEAFVDTFTGKKRYSIEEWIKKFSFYRSNLCDNIIFDRDPECNLVFPSTEIGYEKMLYVIHREWESKSFCLEFAVEDILSEISDNKLNLEYISIVKDLYHKRKCSIDGYKFELIYDIGVLKKIKCKCSDGVGL